jgi:hypothetical protein
VLAARVRPDGQEKAPRGSAPIICHPGSSPGRTAIAAGKTLLADDQPRLDRETLLQGLLRHCLLLGRRDEARRLTDRALEFCSSQPGFAAHALHLLGDIAAHPDQFDAGRGETHYRQALALAEGLGMQPLVAHCHLGLGHISRRTGARERAQEHIATATTMYRDLGMTHWLEQAEAELQ